MGAAKMKKKRKQKLPTTPLSIRVEDAQINSHLIHLINALSTIPPSPSTPYYPPIFLSPSSLPAAPSPSPSPAPSSGHSSLPTAAIVGGSVAGAVVALAVTATIASSIAGKVGISCLLAPVLKLLTSFGGTVTTQYAKLNSLCRNLQGWNCKKDGSDKTGDAAQGKADGDNIDLYEVFAGYSPEAAKKAETAAATAYSMAKSPLHDVLKAHSDQLGPSAQAFLATQVCDFAEEELNKQKALMMQPLNQNVLKAQEYFESLYTATSNASDDLKTLKTSAHTFLHDASKLKASAEHIGKLDVALMFDEAMKEGAEKIKNSSIANEYAAEMKRLQKLQNESIIIEEEVVLNRLLGKAPLSSLPTNIHEDTFKQSIHENDAGVDRGGPLCIVQTPSDANELLREETGRAIGPYHGSADQQYLSNVSRAEATRKLDESSTTAMSTSNRALVPTKASTGSQEAMKAPAGPIVPMPTKAITLMPTRTMTSAPEATWQLTQQGKARKRPTNLGHVSFSCEISAHRLLFFTSCRSGGRYGSPPPSHARDDHNYYNDSNNNNHVEIHRFDQNSTNNDNGDLTNNYSNSFSSYPISYGGNNHVGLLASSKAPIKQHYNMNVQDYELISDSSSSHQIPRPITSTNISNSHSPLDYGSPFDGVL